MDKFIKLLFEIQNTVIIPGLGAIVLENPETGKLIFNEYLKFNDGKLDAIIIKESNMDLQEAQNYIAKYVREIEKKINTGESYDIYGLGSVKKNEDGTVSFEGNLNTKKSADNGKQDLVHGPSPTPTPNVKPTPSNTKKEEPKSETKETTSKKEKLPEAKETTSSTASKTTKEESSTVKKEKVKEADKKKEKEVKKKPKKDIKPEKKKGTKKSLSFLFWIIIILLVIAGAGGTYIGLNYEQVKEYMGWNQFDGAKELAEKIQDKEADKENEEDDLSISEAAELDDPKEEKSENISEDEKSTLNNDQTPKEEEVQKPVEDKLQEPVKVESEPELESKAEPKNETTQIITEGDFHLIAGAFSEKSNAEELVSDLKVQGLPAQIIGFLNGMHYVSAKSFGSADEAHKGKSSIQNNVPKAWVYKKP